MKKDNFVKMFLANGGILTVRKTDAINNADAIAALTNNEPFKIVATIDHPVAFFNFVKAYNETFKKNNKKAKSVDNNACCNKKESAKTCSCSQKKTDDKLFEDLAESNNRECINKWIESITKRIHIIACKSAAGSVCADAALTMIETQLDLIGSNVYNKKTHGFNPDVIEVVKEYPIIMSLVNTIVNNGESIMTVNN